MKVSLNCYPPSTPTGLGTLARHLISLLPFEKQLLSCQHPRFPAPGRWGSAGPALSGIHTALESTDCVVSLERPLPGIMFREAKAAGKRTVLIVMHEWINTRCEWLPYTDLFIAPNSYCMEKLRKLGLGDRSVQLSLPLCLDSLPFTQRTKAESFVFSNGWGGVNGRKGWDELREALELMELAERDCIHLNSQSQIQLTGKTGSLKSELWLSNPSPSSQEIYKGSDVAIVPSRCEGLGYSILEPMALGLPVLATDAEPMSSYLREAYGSMAEMCLLPVKKELEMPVWGHPVKYSLCCPIEMVRAITRFKELKASLISEFSDRGSQYVESVLGVQAAENLWNVINSTSMQEVD